LVTHVVFGAGSAFAISPVAPAYLRLYLAVALSLLVNPVIDGLGHTRRGGFIARTPLTHSVFTAPLWGCAVGYLIWAVPMELGMESLAPLEWVVFAGTVVSLGHLLLDSLTERGVYLLRGRMALAHFRSGNFLLNSAFVALGLGLVASQAAAFAPS
jgi:membrane-bound metal-dependent hydrolase YbcI (DUF457 family)